MAFMKIFRVVGTLCSLVLFGFFFLNQGHAAKRLKIEIGDGVMEPEPIALVMDAPDDLLQEMNDIIANDLKKSGFFSIVSPNSFLQTASSIEKSGPNFKDWGVIKARFLLWAKCTQTNDQVNVKFFLYDVFSKTKMTGLETSLSYPKRRNLFHMIADHIFERITNEAPYFNSSIIFVQKIREKGTPIRCLRHAKQDGYGVKDLTSRTTLVTTPRISPDGTKVAFVSYENSKPQIFVLNLKTNQKKLLNNLDGMTYAPRWHSNNVDVVFCRCENGASAVYKMNTNSGSIVRLTSHKSIDTSPCFSPDGKEIVFVSDRENENATANLYVMSSNGQNIRRITFGEGKYFQPVWSPRGDLIAFIKQYKGSFYLGVIDPDGTGERLIAQHYLIDSISWAPNGRYLMYAKEESVGKGDLIQIDCTGNIKNTIHLPADTKNKIVDGEWLPLEGRLITP
jgi:TolB protein